MTIILYTVQQIHVIGLFEFLTTLKRRLKDTLK